MYIYIYIYMCVCVIYLVSNSINKVSKYKSIKINTILNIRIKLRIIDLNILFYFVT